MLSDGCCTRASPYTTNLIQGRFWYSAMVQFCRIDLKSQIISIISEKSPNSYTIAQIWGKKRGDFPSTLSPLTLQTLFQWQYFTFKSSNISSMNEQTGILHVVLNNRDLVLVVRISTNSLLAILSNDIWYDFIAVCWCAEFLWMVILLRLCLLCFCH